MYRNYITNSTIYTHTYIYIYRVHEKRKNGRNVEMGAILYRRRGQNNE